MTNQKNHLNKKYSSKVEKDKIKQTVDKISKTIYKIVWTKEAQKGLKKLDFTISEKFVAKIEKHLVKNPRQLGKPLTVEYKGCYRYRFGDFRIIYRVKEKELVVLVLRAGHRKEVY